MNDRQQSSRLTALLVARPRTAIVLLLLATVVLSAGITRLRVDTDVTRDLPQHIPAKRLYDRMQKLFPSREMVVVGIEDESLFTPAGIARLDRLTRRLEALPGVDSVLSPTSARIIEATDDGLRVRRAAEPLPADAAQAEAVKHTLLEQPLYRGTLVSADARAVLIMIMVKAATREADVAERVIELARDPARNEGFTMHVTGRAAATYWAKVIMGRDMGLLTGIALLVVMLLLGLSFRSPRGVLLPLLVVVGAVLWTLGLMGYLGVPLTHSTEVLPILLIAMGVADGIHILKGYHARSREGGTPARVVTGTMTDLQRPVVLTSITTAVGFLALNTSGIESIMMLGLFTAFGVMAALLFSVAFLPAVLVLLPLPGSRRRPARHFTRLEDWAGGYASWLVKHRRAALAGIVVLIVLAGLGATRVPVEMSNLQNFRPDHPFRRDTEVVNRHFPAASTLMVVVEGGRPDAIKDPGLLRRMDELENFLRRQPHVGPVQSLTGFIKQMHRVLHGDRPQEYRLPRETEHEQVSEATGEEGGPEHQLTFTVPGRQLIAQYLQLYEMSGQPEDFAHLVTYDYSTARITVLLDTDRASHLNRLSRAVRQYLDHQGAGLHAELTGMTELIRAVNEMVISGQGWSIATSLLLVWLVTALMFRSLLLGLFATLPLFFSLFLNFGVMGLAGIALNVMTMATSSVAVGVGIDYAIHFVHRYQERRRAGDDYGRAASESMRRSGVAIFLNALTVATGFAALMFSEFGGVAQMGFLIALTMITSAFGALTILPALFVALRPRVFAVAGGEGHGGES